MDFEYLKNGTSLLTKLYKKLALIGSKSILRFIGMYLVFCFAICAAVFCFALVFEKLGKLEHDRFWSVLEQERKIYHLKHAKDYISTCMELIKVKSHKSEGICERASNAFYSYSRWGDSLKQEAIKNGLYEEMIVQLNVNISQAEDLLKQAKHVNTSENIHEFISSKVFIFGFSSFLYLIMLPLLYKSHRYSKRQLFSS